MNLQRRDFLPAFALAAGVSAAPVQTTHTDGPLVHPESGMVLPESVGEFTRFRETRGGTNAVSAGYGYDSGQGRIAATFIAFLPPDDPEFCKRYVDAARQSLPRSRANVQVLQPPEAPPIEGYATAAGIAARFDYEANPGGPSFRSDQYYYCDVGGKWIVQYDFAYPADFDASGQIARFLHDLKVAIPPAP